MQQAPDKQSRWSKHSTLELKQRGLAMLCAMISSSGLLANIFVQSAAAGLCAEAGAWAEAALLATSHRSDSVLSNAAISACGRTAKGPLRCCRSQFCATHATCRSRNWFQAMLTITAMKKRSIELTPVTVTGLITASAGLTWNQPQEAPLGQLGDWQRAIALLADLAKTASMSKEATAAAAACCAQRWAWALHSLTYFGLHGNGKIDGILAGAVINAAGIGYAWTEAASLFRTLPACVTKFMDATLFSNPPLLDAWRFAKDGRKLSGGRLQHPHYSLRSCNGGSSGLMHLQLWLDGLESVLVGRYPKHWIFWAAC